MSRPLVVVSNRGPSTFTRVDGEIVAGPPSGGLARGLRPLVAATGGTWIACAVSETDRAAAQLEQPDPAVALRLLAPDPELYRQAYDTIANATLWYMHHGLWDLPRAPVFDASWHAAWAAFVSFNELISGEVIEHAPADAVVLVQDYHFALLAERVRMERPDLALAHFSHTPFTGPEGLAVLPRAAADQLMSAMCAFDAVGFHTERWAERFRACAAERALAPPRTFVSPLPPDTTGIAELAGSDTCERRLAAIDERIGQRSFIYTSGRMELSKNLVRALLGYERLLELRSDLHERIVFGAFVYPSREGLDDYARYAEECVVHASRINERFGRPGWEPVWFDSDDDLSRSIAGLRRYDVLVINPIRDGLNLVAFEGPTVNERSGVVVLSTEAGAADQLGDHALLVSPFDVAETAAQLANALDMDLASRRERHDALRRAALAGSIDDWLVAHLRALDVDAQTVRG